MSDSTLQVGVLLSGTGRTLENLLDVHRRDPLPVQFRHVIASRDGVRGLDVAHSAGIPSSVLRPSDFPNLDDYGHAIARRFKQAGVEWVVMAGFVHLWRMPPEFADRVVNIHPSLLPAFGGKGFYGSKVHQAVWDEGVKLSGCTVHFADDQYDRGPILLQRAVAIDDCAGPEEIAQRVFEEECRAYPDALRLLASGRLVRQGRRVEIQRSVGK